MKAITFLGDTRDRIREFPDNARVRAGFELREVQKGNDPSDWKPMPSIGAGVREIRVRDTSGAFRTIYLATRPEAIYVLHCFRKKSQKTAREDIELARQRLARVPRRTSHE